jgi:hypothetical protein
MLEQQFLKFGFLAEPMSRQSNPINAQSRRMSVARGRQTQHFPSRAGKHANVMSASRYLKMCPRSSEIDIVMTASRVTLASGVLALAVAAASALAADSTAALASAASLASAAALAFARASALAFACASASGSAASPTASPATTRARACASATAASVCYPHATQSASIKQKYSRSKTKAVLHRDNQYRTV